MTLVSVPGLDLNPPASEEQTRPISVQLGNPSQWFLQARGR
jgi:hypothetical protein